MARLAVLTSGGDAPGMNAAIRAVVRVAASRGFEVYGVRRGYLGLMRSEFVPMDSTSVGGIIEEGGTILRSARCPEFNTPDGVAVAVASLERAGIERLVVIGGDGSMRGALELARQRVATAGVPATIDNDVPATDMSIGADTGLNTVVEAIDRIRDTASAHERVFIVQTMGRACGWLALEAGLATGADIVLIPEVPWTYEEVCAAIQRRVRDRKGHTIIVIAEGCGADAVTVAQTIKERINIETRVTVLGHLQRGGAPTGFDRILASRLGAAAADLLRNGSGGVMVGLHGRGIGQTPLEEVVTARHQVDLGLYQLEGVFAI